MFRNNFNYFSHFKFFYLKIFLNYGLQAEVWSVFVAVIRKSNRNLEACSRVGLIGIVSFFEILNKMS